jgi:hypothetical protein
MGQGCQVTFSVVIVVVVVVVNLAAGAERRTTSGVERRQTPVHESEMKFIPSPRREISFNLNTIACWDLLMTNPIHRLRARL